MQTKTIVCPGPNRRLTLAQHNAIIRAVKAQPLETIYKRSFSNWFPTSGHEILSEWRAMCDNRINRHVRQAGRKFDDLYQVGLMRDADRLRQMANRVRVYQFETPELTKRFGHLLANRAD